MRRHESDAREVQGPGWYDDPQGRFKQRYRDDDRFTAYVGGPDRVFWDLIFCERLPKDHEARDLAGVVLLTGEGWVEFGRQSLHIGCSGPDEMSITIAITSLKHFQVERVDGQYVQLVVHAEAHSGNRTDPGGHIEPHRISVSMKFARTYEALLYGLCSYAEKACRRGLSHHMEIPTTQPPAEASAPAPRADSPTPPSAETPAPQPPTETPAPQSNKVGVAPEQMHPADRCLVLSVTLAPDTSDWLSFAAPTTYELLSIPAECGQPAISQDLSRRPATSNE
jgi:hypothetical protein